MLKEPSSFRLLIGRREGAWFLSFHLFFATFRISVSRFRTKNYSSTDLALVSFAELSHYISPLCFILTVLFSFFLNGLPTTFQIAFACPGDNIFCAAFLTRVSFACFCCHFILLSFLPLLLSKSFPKRRTNLPSIICYFLAIHRQ